MNNHSPHTGLLRSLSTGLVMVALSALINPSSSEAADTAAGATIRNVVKITYKDSGGNGSYRTSASATATVLLKTATPTIGTVIATPGSQTVTSGAVQQFELQIYSNANGSDGYTFDVKTGTTSDTALMSGVNRYIISYKNPQDAVIAGGTATFSIAPTIGASIILADDNVDKVSVPFGSTNGISLNDFVIINGTTYKVRAINPGVTGSHDTTNDILVAETPATIQLWKADGVTAADFSGVNLTGATISQRYLVTVGVTGAPPAATGDMYTNVDLYPTSDNTLKNSKTDLKSTFTAPTVTIGKAVTPIAGGKPGDFLEYTVTVTGGTANVTKVVVTDAVPIYTKLVSYPTPYVGKVAGDAAYDATHIFATITKGATTVQITGTAGDNAAEGTGGTGYGNAPLFAAGQPLTFFLGATSANNDGGTVATGEIYIIKYTVQIL